MLLRILLVIARCGVASSVRCARLVNVKFVRSVIKMSLFANEAIGAFHAVKLTAETRKQVGVCQKMR